MQDLAKIPGVLPGVRRFAGFKSVCSFQMFLCLVENEISSTGREEKKRTGTEKYDKSPEVMVGLGKRIGKEQWLRETKPHSNPSIAACCLWD